MAGEPILGKAHAEPHRDYQEMTWPRFLLLRSWAQRVADHEQAPVYLVGSALYKPVPRDLDVSIIVPHARFVAQFGSIPEPLTPMMQQLLHETHIYLFTTRPYWKWMIDMGLYTGFTRIDFRICPDSWWPEKDKLLLAMPRTTKPSDTQETYPNE